MNSRCFSFIGNWLNIASDLEVFNQMYNNSTSEYDNKYAGIKVPLSDDLSNKIPTNIITVLSSYCLFYFCNYISGQSLGDTNTVKCYVNC